MHRFTFFLLFLVGCVELQPDKGLVKALPPPGVQSDPNLPPMPVFEIQNNWIIVETREYGEETVAVVTLERPELAGLMRLEVVKPDCSGPIACAERMRAMIDQVGIIKTHDPPGPDTDHEAGFLWTRDERKPDGSPDETTHGKVLFRRIPGQPGMLALCEGWWPESTGEFLVSPLHASCKSVRPGP